MATMDHGNHGDSLATVSTAFFTTSLRDRDRLWTMDFIFKNKAFSLFFVSRMI